MSDNSIQIQTAPDYDIDKIKPNRRREDRGMIASRLARSLTPEQLDELLAITWFDLTPGRCPTSWPAGDAYDTMIRDKIIKPTIVPGWSRRAWRMMVITHLGRLTLLFRIKDDLRDAGKLPPEREYEGDE